MVYLRLSSCKCGNNPKNGVDSYCQSTSSLKWNQRPLLLEEEPGFKNKISVGKTGFDRKSLTGILRKKICIGQAYAANGHIRQPMLSSEFTDTRVYGLVSVSLGTKSAPNPPSALSTRHTYSISREMLCVSSITFLQKQDMEIKHTCLILSLKIHSAHTRPYSQLFSKANLSVKCWLFRKICVVRSLRQFAISV